MKKALQVALLSMLLGGGASFATVGGTHSYWQGAKLFMLDKLSMTSNSGTCTLNAASPSVCTGTVTTSAKCGCFATGTTAAAAIAAAASVSSTTLTCTGPNGSGVVLNYLCDR